VPRPTKGKEYVPLGTYIPRDLEKLMDLAAKREGKTKRELVEEGLRKRVTPAETPGPKST
jgi:hypothetical protein